jgi:hypothetical protein
MEENVKDYVANEDNINVCCHIGRRAKPMKADIVTPE